MRHAPPGKPVGEQAFEVVATLAQLRPAVGENLRHLGQQPGHEQLFEHRGAEVIRQSGRDQAPNQRRIGANPADAHAAPD